MRLTWKLKMKKRSLPSVQCTDITGIMVVIIATGKLPIVIADTEEGTILISITPDTGETVSITKSISHLPMSRFLMDVTPRTTDVTLHIMSQSTMGGTLHIIIAHTHHWIDWKDAVVLWSTCPTLRGAKYFQSLSDHVNWRPRDCWLPARYLALYTPIWLYCTWHWWLLILNVFTVVIPSPYSCLFLFLNASALVLVSFHFRVYCATWKSTILNYSQILIVGPITHALQINIKLPA